MSNGMDEKTWDRARGRWREILPQLGVEARFLSGRNGPCPSCGGKDRFRYDDRTKNGDYFCNQCGAGKGIKLTMLVNGWDYRTAAGEIDRVLGYRYKKPEKPDAAHIAASKFFDAQRDAPERSAPSRSTQQAALWLRKYFPDRLEAWLDRQPLEVRLWLRDQ
jgi:putative DNA primase/helicase